MNRDQIIRIKQINCPSTNNLISRISNYSANDHEVSTSRESTRDSNSIPNFPLSQEDSNRN